VQRNIHSVEVSTIIHATENPDKVQAALGAVIPVELKEKFTKRYVTGHHGNPIVTVTAKLTRPADIDQFVKHFVPKLPSDVKLEIASNLNVFSDSEGNLYIRVDKQACLSDTIRLADDDPIRIKMKFSRFSGETGESMKQFLGLE
jgi:RNA binding exosome subunit